MLLTHDFRGAVAAPVEVQSQAFTVGAQVCGKCVAMKKSAKAFRTVALIAGSATHLTCPSFVTLNCQTCVLFLNRVVAYSRHPRRRLPGSYGMPLTVEWWIMIASLSYG